jgi:O-antigen/teichoic acid export membrane protein
MVGWLSRRSSPARVFVSWTPHPRADAIAQALGASVYCPPPGSRRWPAPLRYVIQTLASARHLIGSRPADVFFTNPPVFAGVVVVLLARLLRARAWSDSHSGAFNDPRWMRFARVNEWVMRRCAGVIVTNRALAARVHESGGRPVVLNMVAPAPRPRQPSTAPTILAPLSYAFDEPVRELLEAAVMAPEVKLTLTGRAPDWVARAAPENCILTGWLARADYEQLLSEAAGMICLTDRELTMQMGAFEALEYGIPMLASGTEALRDYLNWGGVVFAEDHEPATLASGMQELWRERDRLMKEALVGQRAAFERAERELSDLRAALEAHPTTAVESAPGAAAPGQRETRLRRALTALTGDTGLWARRVSLVVLLTLFTRLIGFVYLVVVLRTLPTAAAGLAFFFINTAYFVVQPVSGGPATAMIRPVAASLDDDARARWLRGALALGVPGIAASLAIGAVLCLTSSAPFLPMIVIVIGLSADIFYFQLLTARHRYASAAGYRLIANVAQLVVLVIVLAAGLRSVLGVVAIFAGSYVVGFAFVELRERALVGLLGRGVRATAGHMRTLLRAGVPTALTGLAYSGIAGFDTYLVRMTNGDLVAAYGAAKTLAAPMLLVSFAMTTIIQPEAARLDDAAASRLRRHMLKMAIPVVTVALLAAIGLAGPAVHLLYGDRYPAAVATFRWLACGIGVLGVYTLLQSWCYGRGRYRAPFVSLTAGACVAATTNLLLVPILGTSGAGMAVLIGSSVACALLLLLTRERSALWSAGVKPRRAVEVKVG